MKRSVKKESNKRQTSSVADVMSEGRVVRQPPSRIEVFTSSGSDLPPLGTGTTTRKTIEVPEDFFYRVKRRALDRRMKEKELWAEILYEYFTTHPTS